MGLLDEEYVIQMLRQIKQESPPPRQEWKRVGKEKLLRQANRVWWKQKVVRVVTATSTFAVAALLGVWISNGSFIKRTTDPLWIQFQGAPISTISPPELPIKQDDVNNEAVPSPKAEKQLSDQPPAQTKAQQPKKSQDQAALNEPISAVASPKASMEREKSPKRHKTAVEEQAERFLRDKLGDKSAQYEVDIVHSKLGDGQIAFRRVVAGIPQQESSVTVKVDEHNGEMSLLYYPDFEQASANFEQVQPADRIEETVAAGKLAATLRLVYVAKAQHKLRYMPDPHIFIDAKSGQMVRSKQHETVVLAAEGKGNRLTVKEGEKGAELLSNEFGFAVSGKGFMIAEKNGYSFTWSLGEGRSIKLFTDDNGVFTGYVLKGSVERQNSHVVTMEQAQEAALNQLKNYLPSQIREVSLEEVRQNIGATQFTFVPFIQGMPVIDSPYVVTVELSSGKITSMTGEFTREFVLPNQTEALSEQDAAKYFMMQVPLELVHWTPNDKEAPILVYQIQSSSEKPWSMDAKTGEVVK
ncbi:YcdB/YcdC domain-containing protein [uncultured Brevibacillus sp.]|uniref:YcdB/YcdC domain-containing protein n=1 Tax=uncultured Brevibacillus sp. TaxID=169970 RepID=UPI0025969B40|nr:YcdB/YcdC domain-containing protein [uncultured Brevibacillus sp.]